MPNRIIRDFTDSDRVNNLSAHAERFFVRLMMKCDDYGLFPADTRLLKANLFPLLLGAVREAEISRWLTECEAARLIVLYEANQKKYVQILNFGQRKDRMKNSYPLPPDNQWLQSDNQPPPEIEVEVETEVTNVIKKTRVGSQQYEGTVSEILWRLQQVTMEGHLMNQLSGISKEALCGELDRQKPIGTHFNTEMHLVNTAVKIGREMASKPLGATNAPIQKIKRRG